MASDAFVGTVEGGVGRLWYYDGAGVRQEVPHIVRDSPGGLSWGFAGKGPSDAALSLLAAELGDVAGAEPYRQAFTDEVMAKLPLNERFALPRAEVRAWLAAKGHEAPAPQRRRPPQPGSSDDMPPQGPDVDRQAAQLAVRARVLQERERRVAEREARVDALAVAIGLVPDVAPASWLPAEPVRRQLDALVADSGNDVTDVARAHRLDPDWAAAVLDGRVKSLDVTHIRHVCEGLRCTPYDLWGRTGARSVAHAYGPLEWPARTEPLIPIEGVDATVSAGPSPTTSAAIARGPIAPEQDLVPDLGRDLAVELLP